MKNTRNMYVAEDHSRLEREEFWFNLRWKIVRIWYTFLAILVPVLVIFGTSALSGAIQ